MCRYRDHNPVAELYKAGYAPKILLSGNIDFWDETGMDTRRDYLVSLGIPEENLIFERESDSTSENVLACRKIIEEMDVKSVIVSSSPLHTRRVKMMFERILDNVDGLVISCENPFLDFNKWWKDPSLRREVAREYFKILWFFIFGE